MREAHNVNSGYGFSVSKLNIAIVQKVVFLQGHMQGK